MRLLRLRSGTEPLIPGGPALQNAPQIQATSPSTSMALRTLSFELIFAHPTGSLRKR